MHRISSFRRTAYLFSAFLCTVWALPAAAEDDIAFFEPGEVLSEAAMNDSRAAQGTTIDITTVTSNQTLESTSTGNSVFVNGNMTNGTINVGSNFGGNGFGSYVMNTGNNAVINSGVSLSVLMQQY
ncbi:MAG: hypothetical protein PHE27_00770 [Alphaproteobacteria bacterium]|nr:hypothetical protein [Alphaproteobacteria bacterium]